MQLTKLDLEELFTHHPQHPLSVNRHKAINAAALRFAEVVLEHTDVCPDQTTAIRAIRTACMWANAAISLQGKY